MKIADFVNRSHIAPATMLMDPLLIPLIILRKTATRPVLAAETLGLLEQRQKKQRATTADNSQEQPAI
jgi:hypothetical protein